MITRMFGVVSYRVGWIAIAGSIYTRSNPLGAMLECVMGGPRVRLRKERVAAGTFLSVSLCGRRHSMYCTVVLR